MCIQYSFPQFSGHAFGMEICTCIVSAYGGGTKVVFKDFNLREEPETQYLQVRRLP